VQHLAERDGYVGRTLLSAVIVISSTTKARMRLTWLADHCCPARKVGRRRTGVSTLLCLTRSQRRRQVAVSLRETLQRRQTNSAIPIQAARQLTRQDAAKRHVSLRPCSISRSEMAR